MDNESKGLSKVCGTRYYCGKEKVMVALKRKKDFPKFSKSFSS